MRIYKLHEYPEFPCDFPHTDFTEDLKHLFAIRTDRVQFNTFINNHSPEYLRNLIDSHMPILRHFLATATLYRTGKEKYAGTLKRYFEELEQRRRDRQAEQKRLVTNGHTEPKQ